MYRRRWYLLGINPRSSSIDYCGDRDIELGWIVFQIDRFPFQDHHLKYAAREMVNKKLRLLSGINYWRKDGS